MMTVIEQRTCEAICWLATTLQKEVPKAIDRLDYLPRIANTLESIAKSLEAQCRDATREVRQEAYKVFLSGLEPGSDNV